MEIPGTGTLSTTDRGADPPAPLRRRRARKIVLISVAVLAVIAVALAITAYEITNHYLGSVHRLGDPFSSIPTAQRPPRAAGLASKDVTFLVGGLDTRSAVPTTGSQAQSALRGRTDTLMLVHLIAGGRGAYVVSIPRDSWVPIPGHGDGKINWAYEFGGSALAVRTVERLTHVRIDHVAVIDWAGFQAVTNALGGVTVDIPVTSHDPANNVTWTAGIHHLNGAQALLYVRDRYGLPGGDFDRENRQQNFLRAVYAELHHQLSSPRDPLRTARIISALTQAVSVDSTLSLSEMTHLVLSLHEVRVGTNIMFATVPYKGTGMVGSQSVVWLNESLDRGFWHAFEYDSLPAFMQAHKLQQLGATTP